MTKFSVEKVNRGTIIDMQSWYKTWQHSGYNHTHVKQKLLRKRRKACKSSWSQVGNLNSFTLTTLWNLAKLVKIFPGIIARLHHTDEKQMVLLREQCAELRKGHLRYWVWTKNGGLIPWNAAAICEIFKISCLMKRHFMKGGSEYHWMAWSFRLVHWLNINSPISAKDQSRIHQLGKKVLLGLFLGYALYAGEFGRETSWSRAFRNWKRWTASEIYAKRLNAKKVLTHPKRYLNPGIETEEKNKEFFKENQTDLLQPHIETHRGMMVMREMISGPFHLPSSRGTPESNCTCREKNHFLFHWNTLTSPGL